MRVIIEQTMALKRTTKRTYRFETENPNEDALGVVYIKQSAFPQPPKTITVLVEVN